MSTKGNARWSVTLEEATRIAESLPLPTRDEDAIACRLIFNADTPIYRVVSPYAGAIVSHILESVTVHPPAAFVGSGLRINSIEHARAIARGDFTARFPTHWDPTTYVKPPRSVEYSRTYLPYRRVYLNIATRCGWDGDIPLEVNLNAIGVIASGPIAGILIDPPTTRKPGPTPTLNSTVYQFADGTYVCTIGYRHVSTRAILAPEKLTPAEIDAIEDGDLRASVIARYAGPDTTTSEGWLRYLRAVNATVLDRHHCDITDTDEVLVRSEGPSGPELRLVCTCPTARMFVIPVPATTSTGTPIITCQQAQLWITHGKRVIFRT